MEGFFFFISPLSFFFFFTANVRRTPVRETINKSFYSAVGTTRPGRHTLERSEYTRTGRARGRVSSRKSLFVSRARAHAGVQSTLFVRLVLFCYHSTILVEKKNSAYDLLLDFALSKTKSRTDLYPESFFFLKKKINYQNNILFTKTNNFKSYFNFTYFIVNAFLL